MYPIKFENLYYEKIWGGRKLEEYRINLPKRKHRRKLGHSPVIKME